MIKIFGVRVSLEVILLCLIVGAVIGRFFLCDCLKVDGQIKEGMMNMLGFANVDYKMGTGVPQSWENKQFADTGKALRDSYHAGSVPLPENELEFFYDNEFKPECCPSTYSNSVGCACMSSEQVNYLNQRGGNRTLNSQF